MAVTVMVILDKLHRHQHVTRSQHETVVGIRIAEVATLLDKSIDNRLDRHSVLLHGSTTTRRRIISVRKLHGRLVGVMLRTHPPHIGVVGGRFLSRTTIWTIRLLTVSGNITSCR
jgi:hypothetical protein